MFCPPGLLEHSITRLAPWGCPPLGISGVALPQLLTALAPPLRCWHTDRPALWGHSLTQAWGSGWSGSPDGLWIAFNTIVAFPWGALHASSWTGLWFHRTESKKSDGLPSCCPTVSLVQTGSVSAGKVPLCSWLPLLRWLMKPMSPTHDLLI